MARKCVFCRTITFAIVLIEKHSARTQTSLSFRCTGRFETMFSPLDPKENPLAWPQGERYCISVGKWVEESSSSDLSFYLYMSWFIGCKSTLYFTRIVMFGVPEMILYFKTFRHIKIHNNKTASSGIISQDSIRKRKQQNKLNIMVTFWAWIAQFITNIIYLLLMIMFYGKARFYHVLLAICTICLNFNILPLFFIVMADDDLKAALQRKEFLSILKMFFGCS